jgi:D-alanyl-D-alanine carboxypeptidase
MATARRSTGQHSPGIVRELSARPFLVLALAGISAQSLSAGKPLSDCAQRLRPLVKTEMIELGIPGLIVSVDAPNICRWTETLGIRDVPKQVSIRLKEHMRIGSITKTFTGTVVLQLVDEGWLGLDDPISRHLTGVPNGDNITIRQLLNMTSGLYNSTTIAKLGVQRVARQGSGEGLDAGGLARDWAWAPAILPTWEGIPLFEYE